MYSVNIKCNGVKKYLDLDVVIQQKIFDSVLSSIPAELTVV